LKARSGPDFDLIEAYDDDDDDDEEDGKKYYLIY
jgi:hypothetical protein